MNEASTRILSLSVLLSLFSWLSACAAPPPAPPGAVALRSDLFVQAIEPGIWRHVSYRHFPGTGLFPSNGLIVRSRSGSALLVDTAWNVGQTASLLDWVSTELGPVSAVVVTHAHDDRIGGLAEVHRRGILSIGLNSTAEIIATTDGPSLERPVASGYRLDPHGVHGELFFPGAGHTRDNAVVYLDDSGILAGTCMVRAIAAESLGNTSEADRIAWPSSIRAIQERYPEVEQVIPGHGKPGGPDLLAHTLDLLATP